MTSKKKHPVLTYGTLFSKEGNCLLLDVLKKGTDQEMTGQFTNKKPAERIIILACILDCSVGGKIKQ